MDHKALYHKNSLDCSKITTHHYSTSFTMGIKLFHKKYHLPIYAIYGYVRFADEIVDTFISPDTKNLIAKFREDTFDAIKRQFSANPIIHSFQWVVNRYRINPQLIHAFLDSMEMDLEKKKYDEASYVRYIYGSAEVIGLMCLSVFLDGNKENYTKLENDARKLGAAFQKVNFLRDVKSDFLDRGRVYFPSLDIHHFKEDEKQAIVADIYADMQMGLRGIKALPQGARCGVMLAYVYYMKLLKKIKNTPAEQLMERRIRIPNIKKIALIFFVLLTNVFSSKYKK